MNRGGWSLVLVLVAVTALYLSAHDLAWQGRAQVRRSTEASYVLPSRFLRIFALGYKGVASDYQFLKTATFYGERAMMQQGLTEDDIRYFIAGVEAVTDLDPYFFDPYILAEGVLTWDVGRFTEANRLLEKGFMSRSWDWRIPFFIGFNHFYFLKDNERGAEYLMAASKLPGSPDFLPTLAGRLAYYEGNTKMAILFLRGMLAEARDASFRATLERRLAAFERADEIEGHLARFRKEQGREPADISDLVTRGYIETLPEEPYGGRWVILKNGRVYSTSKFAPTPPDADATGKDAPR